MFSAPPNESHDHIVQFYERGEYLCAVIGDFLAGGVMAGQPGVVIATPEHRRRIADALSVRRIDAAALTFLDAQETLSRFMVDGSPDPHRFALAVEEIVRDTGPRPRAFGEMVAVLRADGNTAAALALENLWNEAVREHHISLLCGYPLASFDAASFDAVCAMHARVLPAESFAESESDSSRMREIARLQQRAAALEALERERAFLLDAASVLGRSLDAEERMRELASLIVPRIADGCAIDVVGIGGPTRRAAEGIVVAQYPEPLVVRMRAGDQVLGAIYLANPRCSIALAEDLAGRTAVAIENSRLYAMARDANRMKDEFLATLSHELRTPLTAIMGWAKMMSLGIDEELTRTAIETIERSAETQAALIDDILDLSRIVTGKLTVAREVVDLAVPVASAVQTLRLAAEAKGIEVVVNGMSANVIGDRTRLQQVVWNLLANAVKFSPQGGRVALSMATVDDRVQLTVSDHGRGIAPDFLPHVFEPFRQADGGATRAIGGLGLGLAIVKHLVEHHGGTVSAQSDGPGRGATLSVMLPIARTQ
jgi:signal transduction histidine kinase